MGEYYDRSLLWLFFKYFFQRVYSSLTKANAMYSDDCLPLIFPISMFLFGGNHSLIAALKMYALILAIASFAFSIIAFNAGHHHPEVNHDGDKIRFENYTYLTKFVHKLLDNGQFVTVTATIGAFIRLTPLWNDKN